MATWNRASDRMKPLLVFGSPNTTPMPVAGNRSLINHTGSKFDLDVVDEDHGEFRRRRFLLLSASLLVWVSRFLFLEGLRDDTMGLLSELLDLRIGFDFENLRSGAVPSSLGLLCRLRRNSGDQRLNPTPMMLSVSEFVRDQEGVSRGTVRAVPPALVGVARVQRIGLRPNILTSEIGVIGVLHSALSAEGSQSRASFPASRHRRAQVLAAASPLPLGSRSAKIVRTSMPAKIGNRSTPPASQALQAGPAPLTITDSASSMPSVMARPKVTSSSGVRRTTPFLPSIARRSLRPSRSRKVLCTPVITPVSGSVIFPTRHRRASSHLRQWLRSRPLRSRPRRLFK